jgi:hypothetical protein
MIYLDFDDKGRSLRESNKGIYNKETEDLIYLFITLIEVVDICSCFNIKWLSNVLILEGGLLRESNKGIYNKETKRGV